MKKNIRIIIALFLSVCAVMLSGCGDAFKDRKNTSDDSAQAHHDKIINDFADKDFAAAIAESLGLSSKYSLKQEDLDKYEGLVYFCSVGNDTSNNYSTYAYPVVMLCDATYTDYLIRTSQPGYEAPEDEETPDYSSNYVAVAYALQEPDDLNFFKNLRILRSFDTAELSQMNANCYYTQMYAQYGMGTAVYFDSIVDTCKLDKLTSLEQISSLTKLEQISLCYTGLTDLKGIENFPKLNKLDASYTALTSVEGLSSASELTCLCLNSVNLGANEKEEEEEEEKAFNESGLSAEAMNEISGLTKLNFLDLTNNNISDVSGLSGMKDLEYFSISYNPVTNLKGLENSKLKNLLAFDTLLNDASALKGITTMETVTVSNTELGNLDFLAASTGITSLTATGCKLENADAVSKLTKLKSLDLSDNKIVKAPDLSGMTVLKTLDLSDNLLEDVWGLAKFNPTDFEDEEEDDDDKTTITINLSFNNISQLTLTASRAATIDVTDNLLIKLDVGACESLTKLTATDNPRLATIAGLEKLTKLTSLTAQKCDMSELPAVKDLEKLTTVDLTSCKLTNTEFLKDNKSVTTLTLTECEKLTDLSALHTVTTLATLTLNKCTGLTDDSIDKGFGTITTDGDGKETVSLLFDEESELTVTFADCTGITNYDIFDEYGNMTVMRGSSPKDE